MYPGKEYPSGVFLCPRKKEKGSPGDTPGLPQKGLYESLAIKDRVIKRCTNGYISKDYWIVDFLDFRYKVIVE
jgi:hypothetical protein